MTPKQLDARIGEIIAQECGCVPLWENRPITYMQAERIKRRLNDALADAWKDALDAAQRPELSAKWMMTKVKV